MSDRRIRGVARGALDNMRFALRALVDNRLRSSLTLLGIVIGVATVIGMVSIIEGFRNNVVANFERFSSTLVQFQKSDIQFGPGDARRDEEIRQRKTMRPSETGPGRGVDLATGTYEVDRGHRIGGGLQRGRGGCRRPARRAN